MKPNPSPQTGPATALAQLLTEHPELQRIRWSLEQDGMLLGTAMYLDVDVRPVMAAFAEVLGGTPYESTFTQDEDGERFSSYLSTVWRDVLLSVTLGCPAELVAPVLALPAEWSAKQVA